VARQVVMLTNWLAQLALMERKLRGDRNATGLRQRHEGAVVLNGPYLPVGEPTPKRPSASEARVVHSVVWNSILSRADCRQLVCAVEY
jgi:hypothetical protein